MARAACRPPGAICGVVLDGVVQQRGAGHVRIGDPVAGQDADRDPQQVVSLGLVLPLVGCVQPGRQRQRVLGPGQVRRGEPGDLHAQPFPAVRPGRARR